MEKNLSLKIILHFIFLDCARLLFLLVKRYPYFPEAINDDVTEMQAWIKWRKRK